MSDQLELSDYKASKVTLPELKLTEPCSENDRNGDKVTIGINSFEQDIIYFRKPCPDFITDQYFHFPVVLTQDGSPWQHAVLYLLHKLEAFRQPNSRTLESIANDLVMFRRFIDDNDINYLSSPKRKLKRPTYCYRSELQRLIVEGMLSPHSASRRMSSIIGFYRWLEVQHDVCFEYPLWQEKELNISFLDYKGFNQSKRIKSTDIAVRAPKNQDDYSEYIQEGGKLRPLSKDEQLNLVQALKKIGNIEMTLAFMIALTTGARMQTIFTLRLKHILVEAIEGQQEMPVQVGMGTGADTKFKNRMTIFIPCWLLERIKIYTKSERALKRRGLTKHLFESREDHYVFLTRGGTPYYVADNDPLLMNYRHPPRGVSVRRFIAKYVEPELAKSVPVFRLRFHDLRATYGLNLLEERLSQVSDGRNTLFDVLMFVKSRMGHSQLSTTERYLNYRKKFELAVSVQSEFEQHLKSLAQGESINA